MGSPGRKRAAAAGAVAAAAAFAPWAQAEPSSEPAPAAAELPAASSEPPASEVPAEAPPPSEPQAEAPPALAPIEVVVEGERAMPPARSAGQQSFAQRDIGRIPGAFGDPFRALEVMPGVVPMATGLPHFVARGALPSSVGYFLDGIRVPFLFHLGVGPSVLNPALLESMDFYPGPYPVGYGGHVGGVVAASSRPPSTRWRGEASIRLFDAGALLEAPFGEGRAHAFAGGRYSYTAAALALFAPETRLGYWDYQAGAGYALSARDRLSLLVFGSDDYLGEVAGDGTESELFAVQFHRLDLRFDHLPPRRPLDGQPAADEPRSRAGLTLGYDRTGLGEEGVMNVLGLGLRGEGEFPLGQVVRLRLGTAVELDDHDWQRPTSSAAADEGDDEFLFDMGESFAVRRTATMGGHADVVLRPLAALEFVPGARIDVYTEDGLGTAGLEPRGTVRVRPVGWLTTVTAVGVAHQRPAILVAVPGLDPRALAGGLQQAVQLSQGVELELPAELSAGLTGFYHRYANLTDLTASCAVGVPKCTAGDRADGRAFGLEASLRRPFTERVGGLLAYTLSRAERTAWDETRPADFDRTHVLHLVVSVDLGRGWNAGLRLTTYSGRPYSLLAFDDPDDPTRPTLVGRRNALRRPAFFRLDARLEKRWHIGDTGFVSFVVEGMNVTLSKEIVDYDCRVGEVVGTTQGLSCGGQEIGPITIPSVGVAGGF